MKKLLCVFTSLILVTGCASTVRGTSAVNTKLKNDTYKSLSAFASAQLDCNKIEYADVVESKVDGKIAIEKWEVHGCDKSKLYNITFMPSAMGGYTFSIRPI